MTRVRLVLKILSLLAVAFQSTLSITAPDTGCMLDKMEALLIILLGGSSKKRQQKAIDLAKKRWTDYKRRRG